MTENVIPSGSRTRGGIPGAVEEFCKFLELQQREVDAKTARQIMGLCEIDEIDRPVLECCVQRVRGIFTRRVRVRRDLGPRTALEIRSFKQYTEDDAVRSMSYGELDEVEIVFFKLDLSRQCNCISDEDLERQYISLGLVPVDPYSLCAVNRADPTLAETRMNCTHWKRGDLWSFILFRFWQGRHELAVCDSQADWGGSWWFAGVRE